MRFGFESNAGTNKSLGPYYSTPGRRYRIRSLRFLRSLLSALWGLDIFLRARDQGPIARANGSCLQGQLQRGGSGTTTRD